MYKKAAGKKFQQAMLQWRLQGFFFNFPVASGGGGPKASAQKHCLWPNSRLGELWLMQPHCPLVPPYLLLVVVGNLWPNAG